MFNKKVHISDEVLNKLHSFLTAFQIAITNKLAANVIFLLQTL